MKESYHRLIETLIKRELGIFGRERLERILKELHITFDFQTQRLIDFPGEGQEVLQRFGEKVYEIGGEIALMGARVWMIFNAVKERVPLPPIFSS